MRSRRMAALASALALVVFAGVASALAQVGKVAQTRPPAAPTDARVEDRAAIRAAMASFAKAFEARDAKALAAHWTDEGEYQSDEAAPIKGRGARAAAFAPLFAEHPKVKATSKAESLRFQLAINKQGVIRGNYHNTQTNKTEPVSGSVDPKTLRAAWIVGGEKFPIYEAGIANLTNDQTTMLVHDASNRSTQATLVKLQLDDPANPAAGDGQNR